MHYWSDRPRGTEWCRPGPNNCCAFAINWQPTTERRVWASGIIPTIYKLDDNRPHHTRESELGRHGVLPESERRRVRAQAFEEVLLPARAALLA